MTSLLLALILTGGLGNAPPQVPGSTGICRLEEAPRTATPAGIQGRALPSPEVILRWQESAARERSRAGQAMMMALEPQTEARQQSPELQFHPLTAKERQDLQFAMERFFRENAGKVIDARTGDVLQPIFSNASSGQE